MENLIYTIIVYVIVFILIYVLINLENWDLLDKKNPYKGSHYSSEDNEDIEDLLKKINKSIRYEYTYVKWRSCLLFSIIASFVICIFLLWRLPNASELIISILIFYFFSYSLLLYREKSVSDKCIKNVDTITDIIKNKL